MVPALVAAANGDRSRSGGSGKMRSSGRVFGFPMKRFVCPICLLLLSAALADAADLTLAQLPPAVQQTAKTELGGATPTEIQKGEENGGIDYTITRQTAKGERYFVVSESGSLIGTEVGVDEIPPAVQKVIKSQVADGTLDGIEKNLETAELTYDVDFTRKDGSERSLSVSAAGRVTSLELDLPDLPEAVHKTIQTHLKGATIEAIYKIFETNEFYFEVNFRKNGSTRDMVIAQDGKPETLQVLLKDLPEAVQKTINEKVAGGKIVRIDKSYTPRQGVPPFEVESIKDGKPFNFSVGSKGRFLGMD